MKPTSFSRSSFWGLPVRASFCGLLSGLCCSLFLLCLCSCRGDDDDAPPPVPDHTAILHLRLGGDVAGQPLSLDAGVPAEASAITTRAPMTRAVNETEIRTVDVLSFKADASDPMNIKKGTFFYRAQGVYTETSPGQGKVEVRLTGSPERQTLVVLANARRQVDALGAAYGEQKEDVMSRLTFDAGTDASPDFAKGMPMWGELPNEAVGEGFSPSGSPKEVTMIRSVAKFTLVNPAEHDPEGKDFFFYYDLLQLYNYRSKGRIAPDNYNAAGKKVDTPTVPADARQPRGTFASLDSEVTSGRIGIYEGRQKSFYLCEADNTVRPSGGNALDDLCLIVYVKSYSPPHSGVVTSGYYRLDFRSYPGDTRMDILRNHDYQIKVESVEGLPAQTADEAYKGNHTLKCKIVPWNQVQEEVKVSGNKRLSVDRRVFDFDGDIQLGVASLPVKITTENTQWSISGQPSWITLSQTSGTAGVTATVTVSANSKNFGQNARSGVLTIHAGNLQYRLHVKQEPACGFGNNMKLMRIGNNNYMTTRVTNGGVCWMIDASKEGGPNMAARPRGAYPFTPATVGPIYYGSIPHRACPDGWRLPTAWEVIDLIQKISGSYPAVFTRLTESGCGMAQGAPPSLSAPTSVYESYLAIWTQTPMSYSPVNPRHSPASVLQLGGTWQWKSGSTTEVEFRYMPTANKWCLVYSAGSDIYSPAGLPANFSQYYGVHYLNGGSVRAVHE